MKSSGLDLHYETIHADLFDRKVATVGDLEIIRELFNDSLPDLSTKPLEPVTPEAQIDWWLRGDKRAWIIYHVKDYSVVGFVVLTQRWGFETPIFVIAPRYKGKGYARWFIRFYIWMAKGALAGEQLQSNKVICRLNKELGWEVLGSKDGVDFLFHPGKYKSAIEHFYEGRMK